MTFIYKELPEELKKYFYLIPNEEVARLKAEKKYLYNEEVNAWYLLAVTQNSNEIELHINDGLVKVDIWGTRGNKQFSNYVIRRISATKNLEEVFSEQGLRSLIRDAIVSGHKEHKKISKLEVNGLEEAPLQWRDSLVSGAIRKRYEC